MPRGIVKARGTIQNDLERQEWRKFSRKWRKCETVSGENSSNFGESSDTGTACVFHGWIATETDLLHTDSDPGNEDCPFPKLGALLQTHWTVRL